MECGTVRVSCDPFGVVELSYFTGDKDDDQNEVMQASDELLKETR